MNSFRGRASLLYPILRSQKRRKVITESSKVNWIARRHLTNRILRVVRCLGSCCSLMCKLCWLGQFDKYAINFLKTAVLIWILHNIISKTHDDKTLMYLMRDHSNHVLVRNCSTANDEFLSLASMCQQTIHETFFHFDHIIKIIHVGYYT